MHAVYKNIRHNITGDEPERFDDGVEIPWGDPELIIDPTDDQWFAALAIGPHFESHKNQLTRSAFAYRTYEIQTVRDFEDPSGDPYTEAVNDVEGAADDTLEAVGPVYFGVYGRLPDGPAEHIADRRTLEDARDLLRRIGINLIAVTVSSYRRTPLEG